MAREQEGQADVDREENSRVSAMRKSNRARFWQQSMINRMVLIFPNFIIFSFSVWYSQ